MFDWLKKERCKICREERSVRYCLRRNKEIGWLCCNGYRVDAKCPSECPYTPVRAASASPLPQIKSDSRSEFLDFLQRYLQIWIHSKVETLDQAAPLELSQTKEGKSRLVDWLSSFAHPDSGVLNLLNKKLNLELSIPQETAVNPETIAAEYLDAIIAQNWEKALSMHQLDPDSPVEIISSLEDDLSAHSVLRKTRQYDIVNAGFTEDLKQSFVFCELNHKENWTIIFVAVNGVWKLYQNIHGTLQDYYAQKNLFRSLAVAINKNDESPAYHLLDMVYQKYPLCPDVYYYFGLYYELTGKAREAERALTKALALEPGWQEPLFRLARLDMDNKDFTSALQKWNRLAERNPADINVQNNMGVCYMGLNQPDLARQVWENALKLEPNSELLIKNLEHLDNG